MIITNFSKNLSQVLFTHHLNLQNVQKILAKKSFNFNLFYKNTHFFSTMKNPYRNSFK